MQIRRLEFEDLDTVIAIHLERFPDSRSTQLGRPFLRAMYKWFLLNYPEISLVATVDNKVVGLAVGSFGGYGRRVFRYALPEVVWGFVRHPQLVFHREMFYLWRSYLRGLNPLKTKSPIAPSDPRNRSNRQAAFASLAVMPTATGVGIPLILAFERAAWENGADRISHSVRRQNVPVLKIYQRLGWLIRAESDQSVNFYKELSRS
jgi:ribosomal protein S18 acetylase RimI-like enzyme